jgi:hypothetical protein
VDSGRGYQEKRSGVMALPDSYELHVAQERVTGIKRQLTILRQTIVRRFAPDSEVDGQLDTLELELQLLTRDLN